MSVEFNEIMFFRIPESYYRILNLWAAERNFRSSGHNFTAEKIAAEIICEFIDEAEQMELRLQPNEVVDRDQEGPDHHPCDSARSEGSLPTPDIEQE